MASYVRIADTAELPEGTMRVFEIGPEEILVVNVGGKFYAIGNRCTHAGAPLVEGSLQGYTVECPWHGSKFDLRTGLVTANPAYEPVPSYEVKVEGTSILVRNIL